MERIDGRDNMLLAARGTAGQLLPCSVLVWRAALRTVTLLCTHTHTHAEGCMYTYKQITHNTDRVKHTFFSCFTVQIESRGYGWLRAIYVS